jgi:hypothetical protein
VLRGEIGRFSISVVENLLSVSNFQKGQFWIKRLYIGKSRNRLK